MLYISNYDKYNLDKSSQSMYAYYTRLINDINTDILEIRDYLVNMLDVVAKLRTRLYDIKDSIQKDLDKTKDAYENAGYTNDALDKVQEILDGAEEDLNGLEQGVQSTINAIDCNEVPEGCNYVEDCAEGCNEEAPVQPAQPEQPGDCGFNVDDCDYCAFRASGTEGTYTCFHCDHNDCSVNTQCGQPVDDKPWTYPGCNDPTCTYVINLEPGCGELIHVDGDCNEVTCQYKGSGCDFANDCTYTCQWSGTECGEASLPEDCTFSCQDQTVCNYDGSCQECTYSSDYCGEEYGCNETCIFDDDSCTYDTDSDCSYDSDIGFDYDCSEWVEDCGEQTDCSESSSDDDSNVVCTYLIKRLFNSDSKLLDMSKENVKIGLRNGLSKKAFKEYYNGLGLEIIEHLKHETDDYLKSLWLNSIQPVWTLLRGANPKSGVKAYADFIINLAVQYNINWCKYKNILRQIYDVAKETI